MKKKKTLKGGIGKMEKKIYLPFRIKAFLVYTSIFSLKGGGDEGLGTLGVA